MDASMAVVKDLLPRHDFGIAEVAERVVYDSASTFSTAFSRHVGQPASRCARERRAARPRSFPLAELAQVLGPGRQRRVGEIGEQAVQAERVVLKVLLL